MYEDTVIVVDEQASWEIQNANANGNTSDKIWTDEQPPEPPFLHTLGPTILKIWRLIESKGSPIPTPITVFNKQKFSKIGNAEKYYLSY